MAGPPPHFTISDQQEVYATVFMGLLFLLSLTYSVRTAVRRRSRFPLYMFLGAGLGVYLEPYVDTMGLCMFPDETLPWISALGRDIPMYAGLCYFAYFCAPALWVMGRIEKGITTRQWFSAYLGTVATCLVFELIPIHLNWWIYYQDNQPLKILGLLPLWWGFLNAHCLFVVATVCALLRRHVLTDDRRSLLLVPVVPITMYASYAAATPIFLALNSTNDRTATTLLSLVAIGVALMSMWICGQLVSRTEARPEPRVDRAAVAAG